MKVTKVHQHLIGKSYADVIANLTIKQDDGDCCGWANCALPNNVPQDTDGLTLSDCVLHEYEDGSDSERVVLNFVFSDQSGGTLILGYELSAGSGSGWAYGAYVSLSLRDEVLASASW